MHEMKPEHQTQLPSKSPVPTTTMHQAQDQAMVLCGAVWAVVVVLLSMLCCVVCGVVCGVVCDGALQHCDSNHTANQLFQSSSNLLRHKSNNTLFFVLLVCSLGHIVCVGGGYMVALPWKSCCCSGLAAVEVGISVGSETNSLEV
jgi:hypothetical protein